MNTRKNVIGKQYRSINLKAYQFDKDSRTISGYAAIFGNVDKANDMLIRGCFAKSIRDRGPESAANDKIICLWMHDMKEPIGTITKLIEDEIGLYFEAKIDEIELGDRCLIQLESGTINQFSIGYDYVWERCKWVEVNVEDIFMVNEVILYEISPVSIGCNPATFYTGLKSTEIESESIKLQDKIIDAIKDLPINKKSLLQSLFSEIWTLAKIYPAEATKDAKKPIETKDDDKENFFFKGVKFNN